MPIKNINRMLGGVCKTGAANFLRCKGGTAFGCPGVHFLFHPGRKNRIEPLVNSSRIKGQLHDAALKTGQL